MDHWLRNNSLETADPAKATHFHNVSKRYLDVPISAQRDFWLNYCENVHEGHNPYICEIISSRDSVQLGYKIKFLFERQQIPCSSDLIGDLLESIDEYIQHIIGVIQSMMSSYFEESVQKCEYIACYLRRNIESILVWNPNTVEYEGKIIFPYAHIRKEYVSKFYHYVINNLQLNYVTIDDYLKISPINGFDTLIQPLNDQILELYGSTQNEDNVPLKLYEIYGILNSDVKTTFITAAIFTPTLHSVVTQGIIDKDTISYKAQEKGIDYWLPLFFSSGFYNIPLIAKEGLSLINKDAPTITMTVIKEGGETLTKLERARELLTQISIRRGDQYWSWIDIGTALYSVDSGKEGLRLWKWFTEQSDFKSGEDCEELWYTFDGTQDVDIETIEYFASKDNPEKYNAFREVEVKEAIDKAIHQQKHTPIAKAFKACFPHGFICSNYEANQWLFYNAQRWVPMDGNSDLKLCINDKFVPILEERQSDIANKIAKSRDAEFKAKNQNLVTLIGQLIDKLSTDSFKESLCRELKLYYKKSNFNRLKDMVSEFMATPSGVIDLRGGIPCIRDGKPQDYITKCTRYPYPQTYTWDSPAVKMTMNYLRQLFRTQALLGFNIRLGSSLLLSGNKDKKFPIFEGDTNNGKSVYVRNIECAFGSYSVKLPTSLITEKRTAADAATPTLIHSQGAKVAFLQEPNSRDVIQSGTVKEMTGGVDTIYVRDLFQKGSAIVEMDVTVTPILIANTIPIIPDCQQAIWTRTLVDHFGAKYSDDAPDDPDEQMRLGIFKLDKFFDRKIPIIAPALLWIFVQHYPEYYEKGLNPPPEVLIATENFRVANNFYIHFTRDNIKPIVTLTGEVDNTAVVTLDELFNTFRKWYGDQQFRVKMPNKTEFKENLEIVWKQKAQDNKWYGVGLNTPAANTIQSLLSF